MQRTFKVEACWDEEAEVWYSVSDIKGLNLETETIDQFEALILDLAIEMVIANHVRPQDFVKRTMAELVPAILWQRPPAAMACA